MPSNAEREASISRLKALFGLICEEAENNTDFLLKLEKVLFSNDVVFKIQTRPSAKRTEPIINPVEILQSSGKDELLNILNSLSKDDIIKIVTANGIRKLTDARRIEHQELVSLILEYSEKKLYQGSSFLKNG